MCKVVNCPDLQVFKSSLSKFLKRLLIANDPLDPNLFEVRQELFEMRETFRKIYEGKGDEPFRWFPILRMESRLNILLKKFSSI